MKKFVEPTEILKEDFLSLYCNFEVNSLMLKTLFCIAWYFYLCKCIRLNENFYGFTPYNEVQNPALLDKRGETSEIQTLGGGATVIVVAATGVWTTVTIGGCVSCAWTAGANAPGCVLCATGGTIGTLAASAIYFL